MLVEHQNIFGENNQINILGYFGPFSNIQTTVQGIWLLWTKRVALCCDRPCIRRAGTNASRRYCRINKAVIDVSAGRKPLSSSSWKPPPTITVMTKIIKWKHRCQPPFVWWVVRSMTHRVKANFQEQSSGRTRNQSFDDYGRIGKRSRGRNMGIAFFRTMYWWWM